MSEWGLIQALSSIRALETVVKTLSDDDLQQAILLEEASARRKTLLERLYREARRRARLLYQRR